MCGVPLSGAAGAALSWLGVGRSPRNPSCCTRCNVHLEEGRLVELTMVFADLSSFTELTNRLGAESTFDVVDRYLKFATGVLTARGGFIDKYVGDCVMAVFNVPVKRPDHAREAVAAALELQDRLPELAKSLGFELGATVGIATGHAKVGRLGSSDAKDYTAIGPVVNEAARLQAQAKPGEVLISDAAYRAVEADFPGVAAETLTLKGFRDPVVARRLRGKGPLAPASPPPRRRLGLVGLVLAAAGAGCLGVPIIATTAALLGLASPALFTAALFWLDRGPLHLLALAAAAGVAASALLALRREHAARADCLARHACVVVSPAEKRHNLLVAGTAFATLALVAAELAIHYSRYGRG